MPEIVEREIHLKDYLNIVVKRWWVVAAVFVVAVTFTAISIGGREPYFRATTRLQINRERPKVLTIDEVVEPDRGYFGDEFYQTQYALLRSRSLALEVISRLGLSGNPDFLGKPPAGGGLKPLESLGKTVGLGSARNEAQPKPFSGDKDLPTDRATTVLINLFLGMVNVNPVKDTRLVDIGVTSRNPKLAADIANALAAAYIERNESSRLETTREATGWLSDQLEESRQKVEASEMALQQYREKSDIVSPRDRESIVLQKLEELNAALTKAKTDRIALETRYRQLQRMTSGEMIESLPEVVQSSSLQQLRAEYNQKQSELAQLSKMYTPKHPKIIALKSQLESLSERIKAETTKVVRSISNEYEVARAREQSLQEAVDQQKRETQRLNQKAIQLSVLEREVENNRRIYDLLLGRTKETGLAEGLQTGNIQIVDRAEVPLGPVGPNNFRSMLLAVLGGLFGGIAMAFFLEYLDDSIKDPDDLERHVQLPFLAPIPVINPKGNWSKELVSEKEPKSSYAEAYRSARTSILFSSPDRVPVTILVTSAGPGEGKTTTVTNLGITMAQAGNRVLILDADLRKPRIHQVFGLKNDFGLTNLLTGATNISQALCRTGIPNLLVLPSGPIPPNPSELLGSKRMGNLLEACRGNFEKIIIDCPPVIAVTDTSILAAGADGVVIVVRQGKTSRQIVNRAKKKLEEVRSRIFGVILNEVNIRKSRYYYSPYYYYSYYGEEGGRKTRKKKAS